jgi:hypothetical protein
VHYGTPLGAFPAKHTVVSACNVDQHSRFGRDFVRRRSFRAFKVELLVLNCCRRFIMTRDGERHPIDRAMHSSSIQEAGWQRRWALAG